MFGGLCEMSKINLFRGELLNFLDETTCRLCTIDVSDHFTYFGVKYDFQSMGANSFRFKAF